MKKRLSLVFLHAILSFILSSCATFLNTKNSGFTVKTDKTMQIVSVEEQILKRGNKYVALRSPDSLRITIAVDTHLFVVAVPPRKSFVYWENVLNLGLGFLVDKKTVKKYAYPKTIWIEKHGSAYNYGTYRTLRKGTFEFDFNFPYINSLHIKTHKGFYTSSGFMGVGVGLNVAYRDRQYLALNAGVSADVFVPFPAPVRYSNGYEKSYIEFISLRNHFRPGRWDFGYGVNFSRSYYRAWIVKDEGDEFPSSKNSGMGFSFSGKYHFWKILSLGLLYQPNFIGFYPANYGYQHFVSIEAAVKLKSHK